MMIVHSTYLIATLVRCGILKWLCYLTDISKSRAGSMVIALTCDCWFHYLLHKHIGRFKGSQCCQKSTFVMCVAIQQY